jgi:hypothetical protein
MELVFSETQMSRIKRNRSIAQEKRRNQEILKESRSCLSELVAKVCLNETRLAAKERDELYAEAGQRENLKRRQAAQILSEMNDLCDSIACSALEDMEAKELVNSFEYRYMLILTA